MSAPKDSAPSADDPLRTFLEALDPTELVDLLIELAHTDGFVKQRLEHGRLAADPAQLAAEFKRTLQGWRRSQRFIAYQEAHAFAASLQQCSTRSNASCFRLSPRWRANSTRRSS